MKYLKKYSLVLAILFCSNMINYGQSPEMTDHDMVHAAIEDYVLALYEVAPERIERSVHPSLTKIGYYEYDGKAYNHVPMTYQQLYDLAAKWNKAGDQANDDSPREIEIYEIHDKTASAKLTAKWGIDFMHLSKVDGKWKIMNIMWQSNPE